MKNLADMCPTMVTGQYLFTVSTGISARLVFLKYTVFIFLQLFFQIRFLYGSHSYENARCKVSYCTVPGIVKTLSPFFVYSDSFSVIVMPMAIIVSCCRMCAASS